MTEEGTVSRIESPEAMERLGGRLAARLSGDCTIFLSGDLGAGKTTLVRGLLKSLGHDGVVTSPTFTLLETYRPGVLTVLHLDLYRLENPREIEQLAIRDYLGDRTVLMVEWPERSRDNLPRPDCEVKITIEPDGHRIVRRECASAKGAALCIA